MFFNLYISYRPDENCVTHKILNYALVVLHACRREEWKYGAIWWKKQWIGTKFGVDIHGSQTMTPNDFGDPLTFHLAPPSSQPIL